MLSLSTLLDKVTKHYSMSEGLVINIDRNVKPFFSIIEIHLVQKTFCSMKHGRKKIVECSTYKAENTINDE